MSNKPASNNIIGKAWCDPYCPYARFPSDKAIDGSGSCRTFSALYCLKLKKYVVKNSLCVYRKSKHNRKKLKSKKVR